MKNMKKFITLCGFLILGSIACGDADVVKAEAINEQTTDTSGYTITIPSEISFSTDTTNFDISAGLDKSTQIIITASSQNGFNLTNKDDTIPYSISDNLITLSNSRPDISNTVSQSLNVFIDKSKSPMYGGDYKDTLTFNIQEKQLYTLNVNGLLDGNTVSWLNGYGTFGIKINGRIISNLTDFYQSQAEGTTYEIFNIKATDGKHYIGDTIIKGTFDSPYQEINLKFDTNKLTVNYYPNGAQKYSPASDYDPNQDFSINPNDIFKSKEYKYDEDFPQYGLDDADRFKRTGYTCNNMYLVGSSTSTVKVNAGSNVYAKSQDLAEVAKVLSEFKKNDITINLYPDWTPIQSQLNLNANGGTFSDNSTFKTATDKLVYDSSSNANISTYTPTRKGYDFDGWYTDETGGTKVYNADGSAVNGTQYWQNNIYQNTEGSNVVVDIKNEIYPIVYYDGQSHSNITIANLGWSEDQTLASKIANNIYFTSNIPDNFNGGIYYTVFESYCQRTGVSLADLKNKRIRLTVKMKADKDVSFTNYPGLEGTNSSRKNINISKEWNTYVFEGAPKDKWTDNGCHAFVLYGPSEKDFTLSIGDFNIQFDTDVELFAHWTKKNYSTGTVLNIEGSDYIVMSQTDDDTYLVIDGESLGNMQYQPNVDSDGNYKVGTYETSNEVRPDGQYSNTYEGSYIDNYLENTWYKQLPEKLQKAIQATDIKQASYRNIASNPKWKWFDPNGGSNNNWYYNEGTTENPKWVRYDKANYPEDEQGAYPLNCWKQSEKSYNNTTYNTISRHVFLPSVEEVSNLVDLNNANKVYNFLKGTNNSVNHMWFRDCNSSSPRYAVDLNYGIRSMDSGSVTDTWRGVRPSFVIDLSKVDYTVTGSVNYK